MNNNQDDKTVMVSLEQYHNESHERERKVRIQRMEEERQSVLGALDNGITPTSMYVMGMCSDAQAMIHAGMLSEAVKILNHIKIIVDERMTTRDPQGRHDFSETDKKFNTYAKEGI